MFDAPEYFRVRVTMSGPAIVAFAMTVALGTPVADDWIAITDFQTDAWCTIAHDAVSGARVASCFHAVEQPTLPDSQLCGSPSRFVQRTVRQVDSVSIRVVECSDPNWSVVEFREEVGEQAIQEGCLLQHVVQTHTVPPVCTAQYFFVAALPDGREQVFDLIACSQEQVERALAYVRAASTGLGPVPIEEQGPVSTRAVPSGELVRFEHGVPMAQLLADYGPPQEVPPRYPDGLALVYPLLDAGGLAVVAFDRSRHSVGAVVICGE